MVPRGFRHLFIAGGMALLAAVLVPAAPAAAQSGAVTGHVQDAQGQPLQGVAVTLLKAGKQIPPQTSGADGNFSFADLASGVYSASAALDGYAPVNCPGVRIVAALTRHFEVKLMPAAEGGPPSTCEAVEPQ